MNDCVISPLQFSETKLGSEDEDRIGQIASYMVTMAYCHSNQDKKDFRINEKGWEALSTIFGQVPEADRANVYIAFMATLMVEGFTFDALQFQNGPIA